MSNTANTNDLQGRIALVTGANVGIGRVTALELARRGARVVLACRSEAKALPVIQEIKRDTGNEQVEFLALDLSDLAAVKASAEQARERLPALHMLINNAGLAGQRGLTADGFELAFGVNHLGHYLFTRLLQELLLASAPARVVTVASKAHFRASRIDYDALQRRTKTITGFPEYGVSKLANVLFSAELARKLEGTGVHTYSLHPGVIASDIWRRLPWPIRPLYKMRMISVEEGAQTSLYCATSDEVAGDTGLYYDNCKRTPPNKVAARPEVAAELWLRSEQWCKGLL
jgi:NAD(P)-dependent dehydrogenase (short-subunit alcohol dehydrogenase family)